MRRNTRVSDSLSSPPEADTSPAILFGAALTTLLGVLRRRILTPDISATRLDVRGFREKNPAAKQRLETVGRTFLDGYARAAAASSPEDAEPGLESIPREFRGFAYEGAAMAFAIRDGLPGGRRDHVSRFLAGRGSDHVYMAYVGIGWAMARLPRFRWPDAAAHDPVLRWLALDGYGFHQAYFHTSRYVTEQFRDPDLSWPAGRGHQYTGRAVDQGIGRALWFVGGTDVDAVATLIEGFAPDRRSDLYSGAALAATYAGGSGEAELERFRDRARVHRAALAQGCAVGAEARVRAGLVIEHTGIATRVFCEATPEDAARICADTRPGISAEGDQPAYEVWRQATADRFVLMGRC